MFDRTKRNGLIGRLLQKLGTDKGNPYATITAASVAMANYPKGAEIPILPPIIGQTAVWRVTEAYVDKGVGSMNDLYIAIWGMGLKEYIVRSEELDTEAQ